MAVAVPIRQRARLDLRAMQACTYTCAMLTESLEGVGECTGQIELPYGCVGAMPGLDGWPMDRRGGMARLVVRCRSGRHLSHGLLLGVPGHAGEAAHIPR